MLNVDNFIHHLWHHLVFRALSEMQDTESIEELKRLVYSKMLKEIKTTVVFKDTKRAKKNNWCIPRYSWIKGLQTTAVIQDTSESKGCQSFVYSRILNQRVTNNWFIPEYSRIKELQKTFAFENTEFWIQRVQTLFHISA